MKTEKTMIMTIEQLSTGKVTVEDGRDPRGFTQYSVAKLVALGFGKAKVIEREGKLGDLWPLAESLTIQDVNRALRIQKNIWIEVS